MIIATPLVDSLKPLQQFVFNGLTWKQYETLLDSLGYLIGGSGAFASLWLLGEGRVW